MRRWASGLVLGVGLGCPADPPTLPSEGSTETSATDPDDTSSAEDDAANTGDDTSSVDATVADASTDAGPAPVCGNDMREPGEACDGTDLGTTSCTNADGDFAGGTLACDGACELDTSGCLPCGATPPLPPDPCGAECTVCYAGVCGLDCAGNATCAGLTIDCPLDRPCRVDCIGTEACINALIRCPAAHACTVSCSGIAACDDLRVLVTDGPFSLQCGAEADACNSVDVNCGPNACTAACDDAAGETPQLHCGPSCDCAACG